MTLTGSALAVALAALGDTPPAVAASLAIAGVRGVPRSACRCAIALHLSALFPGHAFEVDNTRVQIDGLGRAVLPLPVQGFIIRFDRGLYPGLIEATSTGGMR